MSADKRSVHTDALATLGTIIDSTAQRDAIHIAVEPCIAGENLRPGQHIGIREEDGRAYCLGTPKQLGIVDPFLFQTVREGEMFWMLVYPRQITSLRHVWDHPDFPEAPIAHKIKIAEKVSDRLSGTKNSEEWIKEFAGKIGQSVPDLMEAAKQYAETGEYAYDNSETYKDHYDQFEEFWEHYEKVTGHKVNTRDTFFTCSC